VDTRLIIYQLCEYSLRYVKDMNSPNPKVSASDESVSSNFEFQFTSIS